MKGLTEVKELTAKLPRIRARKARNHYGVECATPYKIRQYSGDDGHSPERKYFLSPRDPICIAVCNNLQDAESICRRRTRESYEMVSSKGM